MHGPHVGLAVRPGPRAAIGLDAAIDRAGETAVELGHAGDEPGIERAEEHARRRRAGAVHLGEHAVAEDPVMIEVVGDGQVVGLVEVAQPFGRPRQDRRRQSRNHEKPESGARADVEKLLHRCRTSTPDRRQDRVAAISSGRHHNSLRPGFRGFFAIIADAELADRRRSQTSNASESSSPNLPATSIAALTCRVSTGETDAVPDTEMRSAAGRGNSR